MLRSHNMVNYTSTDVGPGNNRSVPFPAQRPHFSY